MRKEEALETEERMKVNKSKEACVVIFMWVSNTSLGGMQVVFLHHGLLRAFTEVLQFAESLFITLCSPPDISQIYHNLSYLFS